MGLLSEHFEVDFTVEPHILTKAEKNAISEYIRDYKLKETEKQLSMLTTKKKPGRKISVKH